MFATFQPNDAWSWATSLLKRPTPTTLTGPVGSRSWFPNAACQTAGNFDGIDATAPAEVAAKSHIRPGTAVIAVCCCSTVGLSPM